jgi:hypothetical protein
MRDFRRGANATKQDNKGPCNNMGDWARAHHLKPRSPHVLVAE